MRHEHLVVTVEAGLKERIDEDLDGGESLEAWVADAIERKLAAAEREEQDHRAGDGESVPERRRSGGDPDGRFRRERDDGSRGGASGGDAGDEGDGTDRGDGGDGSERWGDDKYGDGGDDYDEGFEFVDDCSI
jgi:hypothetical protein